MSDAMRIQPFATQLRRVLMEYEQKGSIFDLHHSLFYTPKADAPFAVPGFRGAGKHLATPVGPSAGIRPRTARDPRGLRRDDDRGLRVKGI